MAIVVYAPAVALIQGVPKNMFYSNLSLFQYSFDKNFLFKDFFWDNFAISDRFPKWDKI